MKALVLEQVGTPDSLRISDIPLPKPEHGEVRVKVEACGLNPSDYQRAHYGMPDWEWPAVLGLDVVGIVDAVGEDVTNVLPGQRVAFHGNVSRRGGFAEYTVADSAVVAVVPASIDPISAAAIPSAGLTAYQAIVRRLHVSKDDTVLITGGAGGVGGFAVQLASLAGARVIATDAGLNAEHVRSLGADEFIDFQSEDIVSRAREITGGRGADAVLDTVGSESATANLGLLVHGGGIATTAGRPDISTVPPFSIGPSVHEIALGAAYSAGDARSRADLATMLAELLSLAQEGKLNPMVSSVVKLEEVPAALTAMADRKVRGKIVQSFL